MAIKRGQADKRIGIIPDFFFLLLFYVFLLQGAFCSYMYGWTKPCIQVTWELLPWCQGLQVRACNAYTLMHDLAVRQPQCSECHNERQISSWWTDNFFSKPSTLCEACSTCHVSDQSPVKIDWSKLNNCWGEFAEEHSLCLYCLIVCWKNCMHCWDTSKFFCLTLHWKVQPYHSRWQALAKVMAI